MDYNQDIFFKMQQQQMPGKQPFLYDKSNPESLHDGARISEGFRPHERDVSDGDKKSTGTGGRRMR